MNGELLQNHVRQKRIGEGILLTTDYGSWTYLSQEEYEQYQEGKLDSIKLKENGIVIGDENYESVIRDYRRKIAYLFQGPSLHIVVPTLRCNMQCIYCHARSKPIDTQGYDMDIDTAKKTVDFIFQSPSKAITIEFQGGEPLANFGTVKYLVQYAKKKNQKEKRDLRLSIVTNLVLMDEEKLKFLTKEKVNICTSLDGNQMVHDKNRQEYAQTVKWIKRIRENNNINAMTIITKHSLNYHKEIVDEYARLGLDTIWIKPVSKLGCAEEKWNEIGISAEEFLEFWKKAMERVLEINKKQTLKENSISIILKKILSKDCYNFADLESPCGAAIAQLAYNHDGSIYTCDEARLFEIFKLGTVEQKFKEVVASRGTEGIVRSSINDNPACEVCAYKPYCGVCPVSSFAETGNIITRLPNRRCAILKGQFDYVFEKILFDEEFKSATKPWI
ncbi:MAG: His-Xaa-Ser system radical SAM maturase HxsB [Candidatus Woesearchaeota archaeon]